MNRESLDARRARFRKDVLRDIVMCNKAGQLEKSDDGRRVLVFALDEESLSTVLYRCHDAGRTVNLFVQMNHGRVVLSSVEGELRPAAFGEHDIRADDYSRDSSIGTFITYVLQHPDGVSVEAKGTRVQLPSQSADVRGMHELVTA